MTVQCPPLHSVWENDKGTKLFIEDVFDEDGTFFATVVTYSERDDMDSCAEELDAEQWADLIEQAGIRMTGIEPRSE